MMDLLFNWPNKHPKILCLGAHSDDIEIGCGGTLLNASKKNDIYKWPWFNENIYDEEICSMKTLTGNKKSLYSLYGNNIL